MISYKCDSCGDDVAERKVAKVDGKEYDLCAKCHAKTVGKLIGSGKGRFVYEPAPQPVYVPYYFYQPPFYVQPQPYNPPHWPIIYCNDSNTVDGTYTLTSAAQKLLVS